MDGRWMDGWMINNNNISYIYIYCSSNHTFQFRDNVSVDTF